MGHTDRRTDNKPTHVLSAGGEKRNKSNTMMICQKLL